MAIVKAVSSRASIGRVIIYVTDSEKTDDKLISGLECSPDTAIEEMKATKAVWGKENGRQYQHFVYSFPPGENISLEQAHEMARELCAERFRGHEVLIATHRDAGHIHSHIIVNSVNYENGYKLHWKKQDLQLMKDKANEMSIERGLSVPEKGREITVYTKEKYRALERSINGEYKSYVVDCYKAATAASQTAVSKDDFISKMKESGYETNWTDTRKHITFTDLNGKKVRAANLEGTFKEPFGKESLTNGFKRNLDASNAREPARTNGQSIIGQRSNTGVKIAELRTAIGKSKTALVDDERKRADRVTNEQSRHREPNRGREPYAQRRSRERPERSR